MNNPGIQNFLFTSSGVTVLYVALWSANLTGHLTRGIKIVQSVIFHLSVLPDFFAKLYLSPGNWLTFLKIANFIILEIFIILNMFKALVNLSIFDQHIPTNSANKLASYLFIILARYQEFSHFMQNFSKCRSLD